MNPGDDIRNDNGDRPIIMDTEQLYLGGANVESVCLHTIVDLFLSSVLVSHLVASCYLSPIICICYPT